MRFEKKVSKIREILQPEKHRLQNDKGTLKTMRGISIRMVKRAV